MNHPNISKHNPNANIHSWDELMTMDLNIEVLIVDIDACNDKSSTVLDLSSFSSLKVFEVGDYSFAYVNEVRMLGLNQLEKVVIGRRCFVELKNDCSNNPNRHFYLKNCEKLRELKICGFHSFRDYSVCEIENVPSLEVIEMGELNEESFTFRGASLELKSDSQRMK